MTKKLLFGELVFLEEDLRPSDAEDISLYKIIYITHLGGEEVYRLQREDDGFIPDHYFTIKQLVPAFDAPTGETEAPSTYHDKHYNGCIIEPILLMQWHLTKEQFEGFLLGNIIKYRVRAGHKDDAKKDIDKALRYEQWLREFQEKGTLTL